MLDSDHAWPAPSDVHREAIEKLSAAFRRLTERVENKLQKRNYGVELAPMITPMLVKEGLSLRVHRQAESDVAKNARDAARAGQRAYDALQATSENLRFDLPLNLFAELESSVKTWEQVAKHYEEIIRHSKRDAHRPEKYAFASWVLMMAEGYREEYGEFPGISYDAIKGSYGGKFFKIIELALKIYHEIADEFFEEDALCRNRNWCPSTPLARGKAIQRVLKKARDGQNSELNS